MEFKLRPLHGVMSSNFRIQGRRPVGLPSDNWLTPCTWSSTGAKVLDLLQLPDYCLSAEKMFNRRRLSSTAAVPFLL